MGPLQGRTAHFVEVREGSVVSPYKLETGRLVRPSVRPRALAKSSAVLPSVSRTEIFAPLASNNLTTSVCPLSAAKCKGVRLLVFSTALTSIPGAARSNLATPMIAFSAVWCKGVSPSLPTAFTLAPAASSNLTTLVFPPPAANCNGVYPSLFTAFTLAPLANNNLTTSVCPFQAVRCKGASPSLSTAFTLAPAASNNSTILVRPFKEAKCKGISSSGPTKFTSAPAARSDPTLAISLFFTASNRPKEFFILFVFRTDICLVPSFRAPWTLVLPECLGSCFDVFRPCNVVSGPRSLSRQPCTLAGPNSAVAISRPSSRQGESLREIVRAVFEKRADECPQGSKSSVGGRFCATFGVCATPPNYTHATYI